MAKVIKDENLTPICKKRWVAKLIALMLEKKTYPFYLPFRKIVTIKTPIQALKKLLDFQTMVQNKTT